MSRSLTRFLVSRRSRSLNKPWIAAGDAIPDSGTVGRQGEKVAARWLYAEGCGILQKNFRAPGGGEVDLVCRHGQVLCFVEVKTRTSVEYGRPALAVTASKQALLMRGAAAWLRLLHQVEPAWRMDVVEVWLLPGKKAKVNWIQSAFNTGEVRAARAKKYNL